MLNMVYCPSLKCKSSWSNSFSGSSVVKKLNLYRKEVNQFYEITVISIMISEFPFLICLNSCRKIQSYM